MIGELLVDRAADQPLAQDDVRAEIGHRGERQSLVEMEDLGHMVRRQRRLGGERMVLEIGAAQRQRPAFADQSQIRQRLLDHDAIGRALDHEDEIEVAVADLPDPPVRGAAAEHG